MPHFTVRERIRFLSFRVPVLVALSRGFSFSYGLPPGGLNSVSFNPLMEIIFVISMFDILAHRLFIGSVQCLCAS